MIPWLAPGQPFPPVETALTYPNGLLAAGDELTSARLREAYREGIFPWYSEGEPVLWWSTNPRMVLRPQDLRVSRSLRRRLREVVADEAREDGWQVRLDADFPAVMRACAAPRDAQGGTWITPAVIDAYSALAREGNAHSVEVFHGGQLCGGLYGVSLGAAFFGESMFSLRTDASKIALATLVRILRSEGCTVIDCQQATRHLASLGAAPIPREQFCRILRESRDRPGLPWERYRGRVLNGLLAPDAPGTQDPPA